MLLGMCFQPELPESTHGLLMPCGSPLGRRIFPLGDGTRRDLTSGGGLLHAHLGELAQQVANRATLHFAIEVEGSLPLLCDPPSERRHYESRYSVRDYGILVTLRLPPPEPWAIHFAETDETIDAVRG
jgi:hypothetical protein